MIWAALLLVAALVIPAVWAWRMTSRFFAAKTEAERWRVVWLVLAFSAGVGFLILALGVVGFVLTGYDWVVLVLTWSVGFLHLGLLTWVFRRARQGSGRPGAARLVGGISGASDPSEAGIRTDSDSGPRTKNT